MSTLSLKCGENTLSILCIVETREREREREEEKGPAGKDVQV